MQSVFRGFGSERNAYTLEHNLTPLLFVIVLSTGPSISVVEEGEQHAPMVIS